VGLAMLQFVPLDKGDVDSKTTYFVYLVFLVSLVSLVSLVCLVYLVYLGDKALFNFKSLNKSLSNPLH